MHAFALTNTCMQTDVYTNLLTYIDMHAYIQACTHTHTHTHTHTCSQAQRQVQAHNEEREAAAAGIGGIICPFVPAL